MSLEVVGAGFGRTGTTSLKIALEKVGFDKCYHMFEVREHPEHLPLWAAANRGEPIDWDALYVGYKASVDWPSCNFWRELSERYPQAKVILTTRDPERWYESVMNTIYAGTLQSLRSDDPRARAFGAWAMEVVWKRVFDGRMDDRTHVLDVLARHEAAVVATVPASRLLVFDAAQGWEPLCRFLDRRVPAEPFPRLNTTEDYRSLRGLAPST